MGPRKNDPYQSMIIHEPYLVRAIVLLQQLIHQGILRTHNTPEIDSGPSYVAVLRGMLLDTDRTDPFHI